MDDVPISAIRECPRQFLGKTLTISALLLVQRIVTIDYPENEAAPWQGAFKDAYWQKGKGARENVIFRAYLVDVPWENASQIIQQNWERYVWSDAPVDNRPLLRFLAPLRPLALIQQWWGGEFTRDAIWIDDDRIEQTIREAGASHSCTNPFFLYQLPARVTGTLRRANRPEMEFKLENIEKIAFPTLRRRPHITAEKMPLVES